MKHDIYNRFGLCWNRADFSSFSKKLLKECTYTSFDYFYKLKGKDRVIKFLNDLSADNLNKNVNDRIAIHRGYYQNPNSMLKTIKECCIMVRSSDLKTVSVITFTKRIGKITSVSGLNPDEIKSIRDIRIIGD